MANPFKWYWNVATLKTKVLIALPIVFVVALLCVWTFKGGLWVPEDPNAYKVLEGENNVLREQNKSLRAEADAIKMERDGYRADLEKAGKLTADGIEKQKEATDQYAKDIATIGVDIPVMDRCMRYCDSRAGAGYPCRPTPADYCRVHYGGQ